MSRSVATEPPASVQTVTRGDVPPEDCEYAQAKVAEVSTQIGEPVSFARVKLTQGADPAVRKPALAQANLEVAGRPVRIHVAAATMHEAVDLLIDRLHERVTRLNEHWEARHRGTPRAWPHEWRHGGEPTHRPDYFPRPAEEREVIRHKSYAVPWEGPDEALFEMESMDYDFHLFTDAGTGQDSVVYRAGPTGYRLARLRPQPEPGPVAAPLTESGVPAATLRLAAAKQRLDLTDQPFLFFADAATGRGNVLYHRYDGHYGLITPSGATPEARSGT